MAPPDKRAGGPGKKPVEGPGTGSGAKVPGKKRTGGPDASSAAKRPARQDKKTSRSLKDLGEFAAIELVKGIVGPPGRGVFAGIGDDAAAYTMPAGARSLASSDLLIEGVHFELSTTSFESLGKKALAVNLSDIAAMGGRPRYYIVGLAVPGGMTAGELSELYRGMESVAGAFGVKAIGGDTCSSPGPVIISVTVLGSSGPQRPVLRSGARPGDDIYVTGTLGDSAAGLELLKAWAGGKKIAERGVRNAELSKPASRIPHSANGYLVMRHLEPSPRVKAGMALARHGLASSMIDISDGLAGDLGHVLEQSGVGAEISADALPLSQELVEYAGANRALELAMHGGEDYELLFTAGAGVAKRLSGLSARAGVKFTKIGRVTSGKDARLVFGTGRKKLLSPKGYEHFRK